MSDSGKEQLVRILSPGDFTGELALFNESTHEPYAEAMEITMPMTKKDLASHLGTTPETISRKLAELEDEGYIQQKAKRKIKILDLEGLSLI